MDFYSVIQYVLFVAIVTILVKPLGGYLERVFSRQRTVLDRLCLPVERLIYRITAVDPNLEMTGKEYATCFVFFGFAGTVLLYAILRMQQFLPWFFPQYHTTPLSPDLALNTAISFSTITTWQAYAGESTMSYFSQMVGLCAQNFLAAAAGLAVGVAFIRGLARQVSDTLGNFWVDLTRALLWILLPGALLGALLLVWQGVPMNFHHYAVVTTVEGTQQVIPQGPVAALEIIKNLGTNGGGFFNANGAHPYENPTPIANFLEMLAIVLLPAAFTNTFGRMVGQPRQGWLLYSVMVLLFGCGLVFVHHFEERGVPHLSSVDSRDSHVQSGGNMEGKEVRFGIAATALFATVTTDASCGAVNAMHDSLTPLGGLVPLFNMQTGEVIFGGVGAGLYGILLFAILAVFIAGLMVGRTPEYLGKKIEGKEVKMAMLALIATSAGILLFSAISSVAQFSKGGYWNGQFGPATGNLNNGGPHGFAEILYLFTSSAANNGSAFGGINGNTPWYNLAGGITMLVGRFLFMIPLLAAAGSLAAKKRIPVTSGTLPTHGPLFVGLLVGTVIIISALTFFPALSLSPIVEHFLMHEGRLF